MDQKRYINIIILIVLVVILAVGVGYLTLIKKRTLPPTPPITNQTPANTSTQNQMSLTNTSTQQTPSTTSSPSSLPTTCKDEPEGAAVITSLSAYSGPVGTKLEIRGCNFKGFEGDVDAWIENSKGERGFLHGEPGSNNNIIKVTLNSPLCQENTSYSGLPCSKWLTLTPGKYKIYTLPWGEESKSNKVEFTIVNP